MATARGLVVTTARIVISTPQPARIAQLMWPAAVKPVRSDAPACEATTDPITATPSDWPTWRLVEATAAATPACARGIPETAVLVIGGLIVPKPRPNSAYTTPRNRTGLVGVTHSSSSADRVMKPPATSSDGREPRRATKRPDS